MKLNWKPVIRRQRLSSRIFLASFAISVLLLLILGLSGNSYVIRIVQNQANKADTMFLKHASDTIDKQLYAIQINIMQLLNTPYFFTVLESDLNAKPNAAAITEKLYPLLNAFLVNNKYLDDLSLYIRDVGLISPIYGLNRIDMLPDLELLNRQMLQETQTKWYDGLFSYRVAFETRSGITLINKFPYDPNKPPSGLMLATINPKSLKASIGETALYDGQFLLVLSESGNRIAATSSAPSANAFDKALGSAAKDGQKVEFRYKDATYMVSMVQSAYTKWKYIDVIPLGELNREARGIMTMTLAMIAALLLLAALAALFSSRRIYRPFENLLTLMKKDGDTAVVEDDIGFALSRWEEMQHTAKQLNGTAKELEKRLSQHIPMLRETVMLQLLQGYYQHYADEQLEQLLLRYDLKVTEGLTVLAATFDRSGEQETKFQASDKDLILFAMKNIAGDLLQVSIYDGMIVHLPDDTLAVTAWPRRRSAQALSETGILELAEQIRNICESYLGLPVTIGIGGLAERAKELPALYQQALLALDSRILHGRNTVLRADHAPGGGGIYPIELEARYEHALKLGNAEEAEAMLYEFADSVKRQAGSADGVLAFYTQLLAATLRTAYAVEMKVAEKLEGEEPFALIRKRTSIDDLNSWFLDAWIRPIADFVRAETQTGYERLVEKALSFIKQEYSRDISLDECAETCGVSTSHLTRHFRKLTGMSFLDYVTQYRMERAKELLRDTDLPIGAISEAVGYQRINFMRVFKKAEGITPGQYREQQSCDR